MTPTLFKMRPIDWTWVGVGYCFFVVFHLLPSYLMMFGMPIDLLGMAIWLFIPLAIIGFVIGRWSRGVTIIEPGLSALAYVLTLTLEFGHIWGRSFSLRSGGIIYLWAVSSFVIAVTSAWVGELVQARKEQKKASV